MEIVRNLVGLFIRILSTSKHFDVKEYEFSEVFPYQIWRGTSNSTIFLTFKHFDVRRKDQIQQHSTYQNVLI